MSKYVIELSELEHRLLWGFLDENSGDFERYCKERGRNPDDAERIISLVGDPHAALVPRRDFFRMVDIVQQIRKDHVAMAEVAQRVVGELWETGNNRVADVILLGEMAQAALGEGGADE